METIEKEFVLYCADCGARIVEDPAGSVGVYHHEPEDDTVDGYDLNEDHPARPDWEALGEVACRVCGRPCQADEDSFFHVDPDDDDHFADPDLPVVP